MMNMIQLQEQLRDFSQDQLINEMRMPSGNVPQYLVLSEMQRRKRMEAAAAGDQGRPQTTVAEDAVAAAGVPQGGIAQMARSLAPQTDMTQNTGQGQSPVTGMSGGGTVRRMENGGLAGISRDLGVYRPTLGTSPSMHRASGMLYSEMAPEELSALANGGDAQAEMELMARSGGVGSAEPIVRPDRSTLAPQNAPSDEAAWQPPTLETLSPDDRDLVDAMANRFGVSPEEAFATLSESGEFEPSYIEEPTPPGFGSEIIQPRMEQINPESPFVSQVWQFFQNPPGMTTGDTLQVAPGESLLPPSDTPQAPQAPASDETGGAGDAGGASDADRLAEQDRWLALARFGLGLMSSRSPTFGGAIGEAGMDALDYMQGMEQQRYERDLAERTLAARSAGSSRPPISLDNYIGALQTQLTGAQEQLNALNLNPNATRDAILAAEENVANAQAALQQAVGAAGMSFGFGPATQTLTDTLLDARDSAAS